MTPEQATRLAAFVEAIDQTVAAHITEVQGVMAIAVAQIVSSGRNDPEWLLDQAHRTHAVAAAMLAYVDDGRLTATEALPDIVREAIVRAAEAVHEATPVA